MDFDRGGYFEEITTSYTARSCKRGVSFAMKIQHFILKAQATSYIIELSMNAFYICLPYCGYLVYVEISLVNFGYRDIKAYISIPQNKIKFVNTNLEKKTRGAGTCCPRETQPATHNILNTIYLSLSIGT